MDCVDKFHGLLSLASMANVECMMRRFVVVEEQFRVFDFLRLERGMEGWWFERVLIGSNMIVARSV